MASRINAPTANRTLRLRLETDDDAPFLFTLFASSRVPDLAQVAISDWDKDFLLRMQFRSMAQTYRQQFPNARFQIAELDNVPVGRLITEVRSDCVYYADIAVLPSHRRSGIATTLMAAALDEPRSLKLPGRVKVLASNSESLRLCYRLGLQVRAEVPPFIELEWTGYAQPSEARVTRPATATGSTTDPV